jgi:hypothetical protein
MFAGALAPADLAQAMTDLATVFRGMYRRAVLPPALNRLPSPANRRYELARSRLRRTVDAIIAERRAGPGDRGDLLSALLASRDPESHGDEALTDAEVADQVITFFLGGPESTANVIAWALYLIARDPLVAGQLRAEADSVLAGAEPDAERVSRLELAGRVITETLRLYPPVWMLSRKAAVGTELRGYRIPAGTSLFYSPYLLHHDSNLFEAPERFDPGRWAGRAPGPPRGAFIPFGSGPRKCIGDQFGVTMATLSLAAITARWHLEPMPGRWPRPAAALTLRPRGLRMRVSTRPIAASQVPARCQPVKRSHLGTPAGPPAASPARVYDAFLGGTDNFPADLAVALRIVEVMPHAAHVAITNRRFVIRAVRHAVTCGIRQVIDLGAGMPGPPHLNVAAAARAAAPGVRVTAVDNDPVVLDRYARPASGGECLTILDGDIRRTGQVLDAISAARAADFSQPAVVVLGALLHFLAGPGGPHAVMTELLARLSAGSMLALSHITSTGSAPGVVSAIEDIYRSTTAPVVFRTEHEITSLFTGLSLVEPGVVDTRDWRPDGEPEPLMPVRVLGGMGRL